MAKTKVPLQKKTATSVFVDGTGWTCVKYVNTIVFSIRDMAGVKTVRLNSGGWRTNTTKERMNHGFFTYNLPYVVHQLKGAWRVLNTATREEVPFEDNMEIKHAE
jgi:hypothetical protein